MKKGHVYGADTYSRKINVILGAKSFWETGAIDFRYLVGE